MKLRKFRSNDSKAAYGRFPAHTSPSFVTIVVSSTLQSAVVMDYVLPI
jgi:hypothetical protein